MAKDLFKFLPSEIINDILLRLPIRAIAISKCVCKSWLHLLQTDNFLQSHLSRSAAAALAFLTREGENSTRCTIFEFEDEIDDERSHDHRYNPLTTCDFPHEVTIEGSANGLLFIVKDVNGSEAMYVWNPISREYIELHCPEEFFIPESEFGDDVEVVYGFGVSKTSGQYKVVRISEESDCDVYTLGTRSWRCVEAPFALFHHNGIYGVFLNGNLHWLVTDADVNPWISCFDLETECFSTFSVPPLQGVVECVDLSALRDCICLCDQNYEDEMEVVIWLMKDYGDEKSWRKEYVIRIYPYFDTNGKYPIFFPLKVFKDGDILIEWNQRLLCYYSNKTKTTRQISLSKLVGNWFASSKLLTPSLLSLKSFGMENVISL